MLNIWLNVLGVFVRRFPVIHNFFASSRAEAESSASSKASSDSSGESSDSSEYELSSEEEGDEEEEAEELAAQDVEDEGKVAPTSSSSSSSSTSSSDEEEGEAETEVRSPPAGPVPEDKEDQKSGEELSSKPKHRPPSPGEEVMEDLKPPSPKGISG